MILVLIVFSHLPYNFCSSVEGLKNQSIFGELMPCDRSQNLELFCFYDTTRKSKGLFTMHAKMIKKVAKIREKVTKNTTSFNRNLSHLAIGSGWKTPYYGIHCQALKTPP